MEILGQEKALLRNNSDIQFLMLIKKLDKFIKVINLVTKKLKQNFNYQTFARSNQTVPGFIPEFSCLALGINVYNFEIFTNINCNPVFLNKLLRELENFHSIIGGRTEIRLREPNILMIDWSLQSQEEIKKAFNLMYNMGIINIYIHKGKYQPSNIKPCNLIEYYQVFSNN